MQVPLLHEPLEHEPLGHEPVTQLPVLHFPFAHEQLAQAVGAARETISLALTHLREQNLLRTGRNQLFFNPDALQEFSEKAAASGRHVAPEHVA